MADISLKIRSDFAQAERDFQKLSSVSEYARKTIEKFQQSFTGEQIDKFIAKNRQNAIAIQATRGAAAGVRAEYAGLEREIQRLIKRGLNPESEAVQRLVREYDRLGKELDTTTTKTSRMGDVVRTAMVYFSGAALARFGSFLLKTASDAEELQNKFNVVFRGITDETETWVSTYSAAVARGEQATKTYLSTLQDIRTGFGDSAQGAAQFSKVVIGVTNDLSSFSNVPFDEASAAIQSGLSGQFEALRRLGVGLNVNIIDHGKYAKSINRSWKEMTNLQKQEAILTGILEQSKNAIGQNITSWKDYDFTLGDAAKTSASFANQSQLLPGLITDIGAIIGAKLLPVANDLLTSFNQQLYVFKEWAKEGTNLEDAAFKLAMVLSGLVAGMITYSIASGAASVATGKLRAAILGMGRAIKKNPIGFIATVIVTVAVPAILWLIKHWDLAQYKIQDFAVSAQRHMVQFGISVIQGVLRPVNAMAKALGDLPGVGAKFRKVADGYKATEIRARMWLVTLNATQKNIDRNFAAAQKKHDAEIQMAKNRAAAETQASAQVMDAKKKEAKTLQELLEKTALSQNAARESDVRAAEAFFVKRAELESTAHSDRVAYLQEQFAQIQNLDTLDKQQKLHAEMGLRRAIETENKKMLQARLSFGKLALDNVSSMLSDLQQTFANAGVKSKGLAIAMKVVASAQAGINSFLAFTNALATVPYPLNFVAAATSLAAGLAAQAKIISTPIPSAQTGLTEFTVPNSRRNRNDRAAVMASEGEQVSVTPRGESTGRDVHVQVNIDEYALFNIIQRGIDTRKINFNTNNIGRGVFAT